MKVSLSHDWGLVCAAALLIVYRDPLVGTHAFIARSVHAVRIPTAFTTPTRQQRTAVLVKSSSVEQVTNKDDDRIPAVVLLLPSAPPIPTTAADNSALQDSAQEIVQFLTNLNRGVNAAVVPCNSEDAERFCLQANALIALGVDTPMDVRFVATTFRKRRTSWQTYNSLGSMCQFALGGKPFAPLMDSYDEANPTWEQSIPWSSVSRDKQLCDQMMTLFDQGGEVEDYGAAIQLFLDAKTIR